MVCLPTDPTSHTTPLPVARGRTGLAQALSAGRLDLLSQSLSRLPSQLASGPSGLSTWEMPPCQLPHHHVPWGGSPPSLSQGHRLLTTADQEPRELDAFCFGGGQTEALRASSQQVEARIQTLVSAPHPPLLPCEGWVGLCQHFPTWGHRQFEGTRQCTVVNFSSFVLTWAVIPRPVPQDDAGIPRMGSHVCVVPAVSPEA